MKVALPRRFVSLLAASAVASLMVACSGESPANDTSAAASGADRVGKSPWCVQHGCVASAPIAMDSGKTNHPYTMPPSEYAMVEVQTRDTLLVGAGLMLWSEKHSEGAATEEALVTFAKTVVGDCEPATNHIKANYTTAASGVLTAPSVACGPWAVRTGKLERGFYVSVDRAP